MRFDVPDSAYIERWACKPFDSTTSCVPNIARGPGHGAGRFFNPISHHHITKFNVVDVTSTQDDEYTRSTHPHVGIPWTLGYRRAYTRARVRKRPSMRNLMYAPGPRLARQCRGRSPNVLNHSEILCTVPRRKQAHPRHDTPPHAQRVRTLDVLGCPPSQHTHAGAPSSSPETSLPDFVYAHHPESRSLITAQPSQRPLSGSRDATWALER